MPDNGGKNMMPGLTGELIRGSGRQNQGHGITCPGFYCPDRVETDPVECSLKEIS